MGFWHTGYIEFHESVGFDREYVPSPTVYRCKYCSATFDDPESLRAHRFERHPYTRPVLWVTGIEVGTTPMRITRQLDPRDVLSGHCDRVWINESPLSLTRLGEELAGITNDTVRIRLENEGVAADFTLKFEVATEVDIDGVDRCFYNVARTRRLDMRSVEELALIIIPPKTERCTRP